MTAFLMTVGDTYYIKESAKTNITDNIAKDFINKVCEVKNRCDDLRNRALNDRPTLEDFKRRIDKCEVEEVLTDKVHYYKIGGKNFGISIPYNEAQCLVFF